MDNNDYITVKEASKMLGKSKTTICQWLWSGKFAGAYQDRRGRYAWHIPRKSVVVMLEAINNQQSDSSGTDWSFIKLDIEE